MAILCIAFMGKQKSGDMSILHYSRLLGGGQTDTQAHTHINTMTRPGLGAGPSENKGFINYVFCRNCAVRNHAGTRLDSSSLVKKQVESQGLLLMINCLVNFQPPADSRPIFHSWTKYC